MTNANMQRHISRGTGFAAGLLLAQACWVYSDTEEHCENRDGDAYCRRVYGAGGAEFCAVGACAEEALDGCVEARPATNACYSACGGGKSLADDPDCEGLAEGSSSSDTATTVDATSEPTGGPTTAGSMSASGSETGTAGTTTTGEVGCEDSSECTDPLAPICGATMCLPCLADEECMAKGPGAPVCGDDGRCVACTPSNIGACEGTTPVCDGAVNECVGCGFHEQCPASACDIATGACFEEGCVVEVDGDGGADYSNIQAAIADGCVVIVHELNGGDTYSQFEVDGVEVAILAADGEEPLVAGLAGNPSLSVTGGAVVYVQGLTFSGNTMAEGVSVNGANLYLDRTQLVANAGGGVVLTNEAIGHLRNCIIGGNGTGAGPSRGITVDASTLDVLYSTIARNDADTANDSLSCVGASTVTVRNSILVGRDDPSVQCAVATIEDSALDQASGGNTNVGAIQNTWFDSVAGNVFTRSAVGGGVFGDVAQWQVSDPLVDIDGDPRPTEPGPDVAGADIP
jgi:hypothetical protein